MQQAFEIALLSLLVGLVSPAGIITLLFLPAALRSAVDVEQRFGADWSELAELGA